MPCTTPEYRRDGKKYVEIIETKKKNAMTDITTFFTLHIRYERVKLESVIRKPETVMRKPFPPTGTVLKKKKKGKNNANPNWEFFSYVFCIICYKNKSQKLCSVKSFGH